MALQNALKARWFWYSLACDLCWAAWAFFSKLGSREIPASAMQFIFTIGTLPVCIALLFARGFRLEKSAKGISYAVLVGVLSGLGGLTMFAAYHTNGSTALITAVMRCIP